MPDSKRLLAIIASALATLLASSTIARAQGFDFDRITLLSGQVLTGNVTKASPTEVTLEQNATTKTVSVNEIKLITFSGEPRSMGIAREALVEGNYDSAAEQLTKFNPGDLRRPLVQEDYEFLKAAAAGRQAISGRGEVADAGRQVLEFLKNRKNSYRSFAANELLGDLLSAAGRYEQAEKYYSELAKAPWPEYKTRANLLLARSMLAQGNPTEALKLFENAASGGGSGAQAELQAALANLGKAQCLAELNKPDEAAKLVEDLLAKAPVENTEIQARAYNALGQCYKKAGKKKDARLAYLHVDVLYNSLADAHAEALANLAELWAEDKPERALEARQKLQTNYASSRWAK